MPSTASMLTKKNPAIAGFSLLILCLPEDVKVLFNLNTSDSSAGISGWLRFEIILFCVDNDRFTNDIFGGIATADTPFIGFHHQSRNSF